MSMTVCHAVQGIKRIDLFWKKIQGICAIYVVSHLFVYILILEFSLVVLDSIQPTIESRYNMSMSPVKEEHPSNAEKEWIIKVSDRCDKCGAQAFVKVVGVTGELFFCGHHYNAIMDNAVGYDAMMKFVYEIIDEREKLVENRSVGSHN